MKRKRIMGFFLALVMFIGYLPLNPTASHANGDVKIDDKNFPDEHFRSYVMKFDENYDDHLSKEELDKATEIDIRNGFVSSLKGIEYFKSLKILNCYENYLTELDVSKNINLTKLWCSTNKLTELDVSKNINLTKLWCSTNYLTELDVSKNKNLTKLSCNSNDLTELDVSKNKNLTDLDCSSNHLTELDVSENTNLTKLRCSTNNLTELDVSKNKNLTELWCIGNHLTELDVSENTDLTGLYCNSNDLTELDVSKNINLTDLWCISNNLTNLDVNKNKNLTDLDCSSNNLTSLDVSKNKKLTELGCGNQQYDITVIKGTRKFEYSKFPRGFNKDKVTSPAGASFGNDALTVNNDTINEVTYKYKVSNSPSDTRTMDVKLNVTYKELVKTGTDPSAQVPDGYTRVTFDAGEGNTIDRTNNRYKVIDVLTGTAWDNAEVKKEIPASATYKDATKVFDKWNEAVPTTGNVVAKEFTAVYKAKELVKTGTDPSAQVPDGYTRVTFDAGEGNTIDRTNNRYKVIDVLTGTAWDNAEVKKEIPASATYKDATKVFDKWNEAVPTTGNVVAKEFTANYKAVGTPAPQDPAIVGPVDPTDPNGGKPADTSKYWTVTFKSEDETKGTVDAKNTVYVLKTETKTLADITAPKVTAKAGYEFDKWEPALDANTTINKDMIVKAYFKQAGTPIPQDPPVVREADPNTKKIQVANNRKLPKTANSMNIELYTFFMILSGALLVVVFKRKKSQ